MYSFRRFFPWILRLMSQFYNKPVFDALPVLAKPAFSKFLDSLACDFVGFDCLERFEAFVTESECYKLVRRIFFVFPRLILHAIRWLSVFCIPSISRMRLVLPVRVDLELLVRIPRSFCSVDISGLALFSYVDTFFDPFCPVKTGEGPPRSRRRIAR